MKLSFGPILALVWLAAIAMVCMGHMGQGKQRGREKSAYAMKRYVRQLQVCLRDVRQQNKILEDKNRILEVENEACETEKEACNTENEMLQQEIDDLEETSQCCVRYNGVCYEVGTPFNTTDGCNTCTCTSSGMNCEPVPGACLEECTYEGTNHTVGTLFPWPEYDCGWCTCTADGTGLYVCDRNTACAVD